MFLNSLSGRFLALTILFVMLAEVFIFVPSIAFGAEINIKTEGAPVGEGAVLLLGFTFGKRF